MGYSYSYPVNAVIYCILRVLYFQNRLSWAARLDCPERSRLCNIICATSEVIRYYHL